MDPITTGSFLAAYVFAITAWAISGKNVTASNISTGMLLGIALTWGFIIILNSIAEHINYV